MWIKIIYNLPVSRAVNLIAMTPHTYHKVFISHKHIYYIRLKTTQQAKTKRNALFFLQARFLFSGSKCPPPPTEKSTALIFRAATDGILLFLMVWCARGAGSSVCMITPFTTLVRGRPRFLNFCTHVQHTQPNVEVETVSTASPEPFFKTIHVRFCTGSSSRERRGNG